MLRLFLALPFVLGAVFSAAAFEAATQTQAAREVVASAQALPPDLREATLRQTAARLEQNWSRPLLWHAGAADALSALLALRWEIAQEDPDLLRQSADAARQALRLSPSDFAPWVRMAKLDLAGAPSVTCRAEQCLLISWRAAPLADPETDCVRLRLWREAGLPLTAISAHIERYVRSGVGADTAARCLSFLSANERFLYLMARTPAAPPPAPETTRPR